MRARLGGGFGSKIYSTPRSGVIWAPRASAADQVDRERSELLTDAKGRDTSPRPSWPGRQGNFSPCGADHRQMGADLSIRIVGATILYATRLPADKTLRSMHVKAVFTIITGGPIAVPAAPGHFRGRAPVERLRGT